MATVDVGVVTLLALVFSSVASTAPLLPDADLFPFGVLAPLSAERRLGVGVATVSVVPTLAAAGTGAFSTAGDATGAAPALGDLVGVTTVTWDLAGVDAARGARLGVTTVTPGLEGTEVDRAARVGVTIIIWEFAGATADAALAGVPTAA